MDEINQGIETLRKKYPTEDDQTLLDSWEKEAKKYALVHNLTDHDGIRLILAEYQKELDQLDQTLLTEETLFKDPEGMYLGRLIHERRKWCRRFLSIFNKAEKGLERVRGKVGKSLKDDNQ